MLQDENVLIDSRFYIIGRKDRSEEQQGSQRADMESLVKDLDASKFSIVMDHQPYDYDGEEKAQVDMVLSGHTHGGQFIPINDVGEWTGENAKSYGYERETGQTLLSLPASLTGLSSLKPAASQSMSL